MYNKFSNTISLSLKLFTLVFIISNKLFGQQSNANGSDLYIAAIEHIIEKTHDDDTFTSMDSTYWKLPTSDSSLAKVISSLQLKVIDTYSFLPPPGTYIVFELNPITLVDNKLKIEFSIEKLMVASLGQTWVCCEGCSAGGSIVYYFNCISNKLEFESFDYYNCF